MMKEVEMNVDYCERCDRPMRAEPGCLACDSDFDGPLTSRRKKGLPVLPDLDAEIEPERDGDGT